MKSETKIRNLEIFIFYGIFVIWDLVNKPFFFAQDKLTINLALFRLKVLWNQYQKINDQLNAAVNRKSKLGEFERQVNFFFINLNFFVILCGFIL